MKKLAFAPLALGMFVIAPAQALEHQMTLESAAGEIAAEYKGVSRIETRTVGTANIPGRTNTQFCRYSISLEVERAASVGSELETRRTLARDKVISGSLPGRCETRQGWINDRVEAEQEKLQVAFMELVEQDKQALLAEARAAASPIRGS